MFFYDMLLKRKGKIMLLTQKLGLNIKVFGLDFRGTDIAIYFYGSLDNYYQLQQWMPVFHELNKHHKIIFLFRNEKVYNKFIEEYYYQSVYLHTLNDVITFYKNNFFKVVLYVNNGMKNFQSLMCNRVFHIHINHGESEKESMYSNQCKAYDYVFVVGDRAIERYKENIINFEPNKFIKVGRPQLDFIDKISFDSNNKHTILYAPTWEATHETMNYSSVHILGIKLIEFLIEQDYNIIYKPHSAIGTKNENVKKAHNQIVQLLTNYKNGYTMLNENILSIFGVVDYAIFDNTSVMIDYLYFNKPGAYIETKKDVAIKYLEQAYLKIQKNSILDFVYKLHEEIINDSLKEERRKIKEFYLGKFQDQESTKLFIKEIKKIIHKHKNIKDKRWVQKDFL
jgi:CDP-glycerol glycerophosphotransferase (TagB/SpsB family)